MFSRECPSTTNPIRTETDIDIDDRAGQPEHRGRWLRAWRNVRRAGPIRVIRRNAFRCWWRFQECRLGVDTRGSIAPERLGGGATGFGYQPIDYRSFQLALRHLGPKPRGEGVFVDYGSGKGRAVLLAARLPFRRVVGVEISERLCATARANVREAGSRLKCRDVEIVRADATLFEPPADVSVVFLYNPFESEVVLQVLERLRQSLRDNPRPLRIIYALPKTRDDVLGRADWLQGENVTTDNAEWERLTVYTARLDRLDDPPALSRSGANESVGRLAP